MLKDTSRSSFHRLLMMKRTRSSTSSLVKSKSGSPKLTGKKLSSTPEGSKPKITETGESDFVLEMTSTL
jgi:hypothetical protein